MISNNINDFVGKGYEIIYADPPWLYWGDPDKDQAAGKHYNCMNLNQLVALPIKDIKAKKSVLFMWTTSSKMSEACLLIPHWGFIYRSVFQIWVKTSNSGNIIHGQGVRPSFTKPTAEYLLVASTQAKGRVFPLLTEKMPNVVLAPRPNNIHSKKPAEFRDNITALLGNRPRVELFSRQDIPGWDAFGNQVESNI